MLVKSKYFLENDAPLTYFKVVKVLEIIWLIDSFCRFCYHMSQENIFGIIEMLISLTIHACATIGLCKKQWNGVIALYCVFAFWIFDSLVALGLYAHYGIVNAGTMRFCIGAISGILIWWIPTWVYFSKRRPLFTPYKHKDVEEFADVHEIVDVQKAHEFQIVTEEKSKIRFCKMCGGQIDCYTKKCSVCGKQYFKGIKLNKYITTIIILSVVMLMSIILNIVQVVKIKELNEYYTKNALEQKKRIFEQSKDFNDQQNRMKFYESCVAIVPNDGSKKYHTYSCEDLNTLSFWIYGYNTAENKGFKPCPKCIQKNSAKRKLHKAQREYGLGLLN